MTNINIYTYSIYDCILHYCSEIVRKNWMLWAQITLWSIGRHMNALNENGQVKGRIEWLVQRSGCMATNCAQPPISKIKSNWAWAVIEDIAEDDYTTLRYIDFHHNYICIMYVCTQFHNKFTQVDFVESWW